MRESIIILDFGSQFTQLIARRLREQSIYCEIVPFSVSLDSLRDDRVRGVILGGGPESVYGDDAPICDPGIFSLPIPTLGICYGMQVMAKELGIAVAPANHREYGQATLQCLNGSSLLKDLGPRLSVWASHGDRVEALPAGFVATASTDAAPVAAFEAVDRGLYGLQFHPEVSHTDHGSEMLRRFAYDVCRMSGDWSMKSYVAQAVESIRHQVGPEAGVVCALSGGVDSSVTAALVQRAVGDRLTCIFVDNGLLRKDESQQVLDRFSRTLDVRVIGVDASDRFLRRLKNVADPERKRKVIGSEFIAVFREEATKLDKIRFLAQGTLYPDVIESVSVKGPSAVIKSHHNVGGLPKRLGFELVEPLRELFKDEVRLLGAELGIDEELLRRQPFPGPGLAIRVLGSVNRQRLDLVREADAILQDEIRRAGLYGELWQSFAVLLPVRSVGVMGDARTYENAVAIRAVESRDGMTADWAKLPYELLGRIASRVIGEVHGINRVVYDISSKPPATIEWE